MPAKIARSAPRPPFELPKVMVAVRTSPLSCWKAGKTRIFTPVRESSGESRMIAICLDRTQVRRRNPGVDLVRARLSCAVRLAIIALASVREFVVSTSIPLGVKVTTK